MKIHSFKLQMNLQTQITKGSRERDEQDVHIRANLKDLHFAIEVLWLI